MKYLVLRPFRSYGNLLRKGDVVEGNEIRSPRLRQSEGLIIPAVSSASIPVAEVPEVAVEVATVPTALVVVNTEDDNKQEPETTTEVKNEDEAEKEKEAETEDEVEKVEEPKKFKLKVKKDEE